MLKRLFIVTFIVFGAFLTLCLYRTFAYDTSIVEETPSTTDLEYTFKIGNSSIKQITVDSGETKYYDVVLSNPNPAKISYGVYYEMVSPSSKPDGFSIEYTSKSTGDSTGKVDKEGNIILNLVVINTSSSSVTIKLGSIAGYVNGGDLELSSNQEFIPKITAAKYIMSLDIGSILDDFGNGVYKVHHDAIPAENSATGEEIKETTDYRYGGIYADNNICLDANSQSECPDNHKYKIIGVFRDDYDNKYKIKVMKSTYLTDGTTNRFSWDKKSDGTYSNYWSNDITGNNGSTIMQLLNEIWITGTSGVYYNDTTVNIDFKDYALSDNAKKLISEKSRYYLGKININFDYNTVKELYIEEREKNKDENINYWDGEIGLIYPSDYGYASGEACSKDRELANYDIGNCTFQSSWFWQINYSTGIIGVISSYIGNNSQFVFERGYANTRHSNEERDIYPTFYLKPEVVITSGDGSEQNPYQISLP